MSEGPNLISFAFRAVTPASPWYAAAPANSTLDAQFDALSISICGAFVRTVEMLYDIIVLSLQMYPYTYYYYSSPSAPDATAHGSTADDTSVALSLSLSDPVSPAESGDASAAVAGERPSFAWRAKMSSFEVLMMEEGDQDPFVEILVRDTELDLDYCPLYVAIKVLCVV